MSTRSPIAFPVGYQDLHPDVSLNFQLNRFWNWSASRPCWTSCAP